MLEIPNHYRLKLTEFFNRYTREIEWLVVVAPHEPEQRRSALIAIPGWPDVQGCRIVNDAVRGEGRAALLFSGLADAVACLTDLRMARGAGRVHVKAQAEAAWREHVGTPQPSVHGPIAEWVGQDQTV